MGSRVLIRQSADNLRRSYLRDAVGTPARAMFDDAANAGSSMLFRGQYDPSLEINYVDDPRLAVGETFTRGSIGTTVDFEGRVVTVKSGEARFYGMRRVENRVVNSADLTVITGGWSKDAGMVEPFLSTAVKAPDGGMTAYTLRCSSGGAAWYRTLSGAATSKYWNSIWIRRRTGTGAIKMIPPDNSGDVTVAVTSDWQRFDLGSNGAGGNALIGVRIATTGDEVDVWRPQQEDVSGQSWQGPSEYVSVGVLPAPYHGPGVDGVRYHTTTYTGARLPRYTAAAPAVGRCGLLRERSSKNLLLQSENFGTTWTATGTPTRTAAAKMCGNVVLDLLGDDDAAATEFYSQPLSYSGDGVKAISVFFSQGTATSSVVNARDTTAVANRGLIVITWTGAVPTVTAGSGATVLGVDTLANGVYRARFTAAGVVAANANRIEVYPATDAGGGVAFTGTIYFGGVQAEDLDHVTSYIPTTTVTVTRIKDQIVGPAPTGSAWYNDSEGSWYAEVVATYAATGNSRIIGNGSGARTFLSWANPLNPTAGSSYDGTSAINTATNVAWGSLAKLAMRHKSGVGKSVVMNGGTITTDANDAFPGNFVTFQIGEGAGGAEFDGFVGRIWHIPRDIGDRIKDLTA